MTHNKHPALDPAVASSERDVQRRQLLLGAVWLWGGLAVPLAVHAQRAGKVYRIGVLCPNPLFLEPFVDAMRDLGWLQGRDFTLETRYGGPETADVLARELVGLKVELFVTVVTGMALAARRASAGIFGEHLELLKTAVPRLTRLAALWDYLPPVIHPGEGAAAVDEMKRAASVLGVSLRFRETRASGDVDVVLAALSQDRSDALFVSSGPIHANRETAARILRFALERRLPTMTDFDGGSSGLVPWLRTRQTRACSQVKPRDSWTAFSGSAAR